MTPTRRAHLALAAWLFAAPASAQTEVRVAHLPVQPGQKVEVLDDEGRQVHGRIRALSDVTLTLERANEVFEIPVAKIAQIARPADSLANGALIGLGAGAAFGLLASTVGTSDCEEGYYPCFEGPGFVAGSALIFGGIGAGIGVGIDALISRERVVYRRNAGRQTRVTPLVGPGLAGAMASIRW